MFKSRLSSLFFLLCLIGVARGGYSGSDSNVVGDSLSAGNGYGGVAPPNFPPVPQFDFSGFYKSLDSLRKYHEQFLNNGVGGNSYSQAASTPNAQAQAQSSLTFLNDGLQKNIIKAHNAAAPNIPPINGFPSGGGFPNKQLVDSYGNPIKTDNGAFASAFIGPNGVHQTAQVFPENPAFPNINTRFGGVNPGNENYHYSVATSSSSHTRNINGKQESAQEAQTTINDNGKITTYTAKNP
ncbi:unnamed protein product [Brassicogethes aeneus]|uniref:Uncharacterized protein n=1 Tax=Brassicogethes aeneus TaxID=1431903 RepID=A0A9P0FNC7_BRAAE|nr:unnamed protein product [Brassicogethes aeneus]